MYKIAPEGFSFIAVFLALTVVTVFVLGPRASLVPFALMLFMVFFFRDPERAAPPQEGYLSAADGKVISITEETEEGFINGPARKISVFMSPLSVHVNRAPCEGRVLEVKHKPGSFMAAYRKEASWKNESTSMLMECEGQKILIRQVAGFLARRTVCRVAPGDALKRGERFGMIKFSSRLDLYVPPEAEVKVKVGDKVRAGQTVLAGMP